MSGPSAVLAFVSPHNGSGFMAELFDVVAHAVRRAGGVAMTHEGPLESLPAVFGDVADVVPVIIPHEYAAIYDLPAGPLAKRTIGFGVEHPGTKTFEVAAEASARLGASFEINSAAVTAMHRRGRRVGRFVLGYSELWDRRDSNGDRDIDCVHLGTIDEARMRTLARIAPDLAQRRTEIVLAPHEPMLRGRSGVMLGADKWRLLSRSRLLVNLHREASSAFEWVRALEAICNGCVVVTEPSAGLAPLVPGEHVLVARPERLGRLCDAALRDDGMLADVAESALAKCRSLDMHGSAQNLLATATRLLSVADEWPLLPQREEGVHRAGSDGGGPLPMAEWVPTLVPVAKPGSHPEVMGSSASTGPAGAEASVLLTRERPPAAEVDVICVSRFDDGSWARTVQSLQSADGAAVHIGLIGRNFVGPDRPNVTSLRSFVETVSRGAARDALWRAGAAPYVLVLDGGDELLDPTLLKTLTAMMSDDPKVGVVVPMAVLGSEMVVNTLLPERRRLERFAYLGRGYLVRREALEALGGFGHGDGTDPLVDHRFWCRVVESGLRCRLHRTIALRLWNGRR